MGSLRSKLEKTVGCSWRRFVGYFLQVHWFLKRRKHEKDVGGFYCARGTEMGKSVLWGERKFG